MIDMTMQVPDELAERIRPIRTWLPAIIDLSLVGFRTLAIETATELVEFFKIGPTPAAVLEYHTTERAQTRLQRLFALNQAGLLSESEQKELDELERIERIVTNLKIQVASQIASRN